MSGEPSERSKVLIGLLQAEYLALKYEQTARITLRENALSINFVALGAIAAVVFTQSPPRLDLLLTMPLCSCTIFWVYLNNDIMVTLLRRFFAHEFPQRVTSALSASSEGKSTTTDTTDPEIRRILGTWEVFHRKPDAARRMRKITNTVVLILSFLGTSIAALGASARAVFSGGGWLHVLWWFAVAAVVGMTIAFLKTADVSGQ